MVVRSSDAGGRPDRGPTPTSGPVRRAVGPVVIALLVALLAGCRPATPGAGEVSFTATDYQLSGPETISAGLVRVRLINKGERAHQVAFLKLAESRTAADVVSARKAGTVGDIPAFASWAGGVNVIDPGLESAATVALTPGTYAVVCLVPDKNLEPHLLRGMIRPLTVTSGGASVRAPQTAASVTLTEFAVGVSGPVPRGTQTIQVKNEGQIPHELQLARLAPGKTLQDYIDAQDETGPAVGESIGGFAGIQPGSLGFFSADFTAGRYALLCFLTDPGTGKPHWQRGMVRELAIE